MTKHTPGPFVLNRYLCGCCVSSPREGAHAIDYCPTHAAAPELLKMLRSVLRDVEAVDEDANGWFEVQLHHDDLANLRTVIAKAEEE